MDITNEKQLIIEDWCWQVFFDAEKQILELNWLESAKLEHDAFRAYLEHWCSLIETYKPKSFFVDARKGHVIMTPDIQTWHDNVIVPRYIKVDIQKIAFILSDDIFESLSVQQAFDEENANSNLQTRFFDKIEEAMDWLHGATI